METCLLPRVALGHASAMRECIEVYGGLIWSIARRYSRTYADAEDATQEVFIEIWLHAGRFDMALGSEPGFIATIARRRVIDRLRKRIAEPFIGAAPEVWQSIPSTEEEGAASSVSLDAAQAVWALAMLRSEYREVLELSFLQGMSQSEIANRLNKPLGSVKSRVRRGLMELRTYLSVSNTLGQSASINATGREQQPAIIYSLTLQPATL